MVTCILEHHSQIKPNQANEHVVGTDLESFHIVTNGCITKLTCFLKIPPFFPNERHVFVAVAKITVGKRIPGIQFDCFF